MCQEILTGGELEGDSRCRDRRPSKFPGQQRDGANLEEESTEPNHVEDTSSAAD